MNNLQLQYSLPRGKLHKECVEKINLNSSLRMIKEWVDFYLQIVIFRLFLLCGRQHMKNLTYSEYCRL